MAPSSTGDGGISADADDDAKATHRKRSVTELKRDVLSLVRDTCRSQSSGSESRLDAKYECFHGACRAWLPTMLHPHGGDNSSADGSDDRLTLVPKKEKQQAQLMWSQLNALTDFVMHHRERQKLVGVVAQSIQATQIIARRRRKRKLPTAAAVGGAAPSEDLHCVVEFVTVWMLHTSGILRLEDVLQSVASSGATSTSAYDWMTAPVRYLLSSKAVYLPLASSPLASTQLLAATTHDLVEHVMTYVIRLAFADSVKIPFGGGEAHSTRTGQHLSDARRKVAVRVLEELSSFTSAAFSLPSLCLVTQILASKSAFHKPQQRPNPRSGADGDRCEDGSRFGRMSISKDRVIAFLQPQISKFVSPYSKAQGAYTHEELNQIFSAYQSCLPTSAFVQIIRQFIYEANGNATTADAAAGSKTIVSGALYRLILHLASRRSDFIAQLLTVAHDLAHDGVQGMNGYLLQHGLELVAAVSGVAFNPAPPKPAPATSTAFAAIDCYREWFHDHFAAEDPHHGKRMDQVANSDETQQTAAIATPRCLR